MKLPKIVGVIYLFASILFSPLLCAQEPQLANDRKELLLVLFPQYSPDLNYYSATHQPKIPYNYFQPKLAASVAWNPVVYPAPINGEAMTSAIDPRCYGSLSHPSPGTARDQYKTASGAITNKGNPSTSNTSYGWIFSPCYSIPTTQYVEDRIAALVPTYVAKGLAANGIDEALRLAVAQETAALTDRIEHLESVIAELINREK